MVILSADILVAGIDECLTQWPGSIRTQTGRMEMVEELMDMVLERLSLWQRLHQNRLPSKIILYRDGVSEGQYDQVLNKELPGFNNAFEKKYGARDKWPKMAIIVVGKRHHTRFYPTKEADSDLRVDPRSGQKKGGNPLPGTVVDRHISGRIYHEFWLQAHQGLQGTARPAHYVVLKDDLGFEADEMETFTHHLCYLFNRATKAVSICPPAYYADLLCERGRAYLFSVLAENHGSDDTESTASGVSASEASTSKASVSQASGSKASTSKAVNLEWTKDVHERLKDSTWYI